MPPPKKSEAVRVVLGGKADENQRTQFDRAFEAQKCSESTQSTPSRGEALAVGRGRAREAFPRVWGSAGDLSPVCHPEMSGSVDH